MEALKTHKYSRIIVAVPIDLDSLEHRTNSDLRILQHIFL